MLTWFRMNRWIELPSLVWIWIELAIMDLRLRLPFCINRTYIFEEERKGLIAAGLREETLIHRLSSQVKTAAERPLVFNMSCLRQALVLRRKIHALGVQARLEFGVVLKQKDKMPRTIAHAWLDCGNFKIGLGPNYSGILHLKRNR
jgi:hypothetical protein